MYLIAYTFITISKGNSIKALPPPRLPSTSLEETRTMLPTQKSAGVSHGVMEKTVTATKQPVHNRSLIHSIAL